MYEILAELTPLSFIVALKKIGDIFFVLSVYLLVRRMTGESIETVDVRDNPRS